MSRPSVLGTQAFLLARSGVEDAAARLGWDRILPTARTERQRGPDALEDAPSSPAP